MFILHKTLNTGVSISHAHTHARAHTHTHKGVRKHGISLFVCHMHIRHSGNLKIRIHDLEVVASIDFLFNSV